MAGATAAKAAAVVLSAGVGLDAVGAWAGVAGAVAALLTIYIASRQGAIKRLNDAEARGRASRDEEVARLRDELNEARIDSRYWRDLANGRDPGR